MIFASTLNIIEHVLGALELSYELVKDPVCAAMPAEFREDCEEELPWLWKEWINS